MWDSLPLMLKLTRLLYGLAAVLLLYTVLHVVSHSSVFALRHLQVRGDLHYVTSGQIHYLVQQELKGNFLTVDINQLRSSFEKLPWVRKVSLRRYWPDTLEVTLEEHKVLARWGNVALVNTHGELFSAAYGGDLPVFSGPVDAAQAIARRYAQFQALLAPMGLSVNQVILTSRRAWELRTQEDLTIALGREGMEEKLLKLVSVFPHAVAQTQAAIAYLDLRYPNGFAVKYKGGGHA